MFWGADRAQFIFTAHHLFALFLSNAVEFVTSKLLPETTGINNYELDEFDLRVSVQRH